MLTLAGVEGFAIELVGGRANGPLRARIKQLQREGFPFGVNTARQGRMRAKFDLDAVMLLGVCLVLGEGGMSVSTAARLVRTGAFAAREAYVAAGAVALRLPHLRLDLDGRYIFVASIPRADALESPRCFAASALGQGLVQPSVLGAQYVNLLVVWQALLKTHGHREAEMARCLELVHPLLVSAAKEVEGDLSPLLRSDLA